MSAFDVQSAAETIVKFLNKGLSSYATLKFIAIEITFENLSFPYISFSTIFFSFAMTLIHVNRLLTKVHIQALR